MTIDIQITSRKIASVLSYIVLFLLLANLSVIYLHYIHGYQFLRGFLHAFYFDNEANFPSLYSSLAIAMSSLLLWQIGRTAHARSRGHSFYWKFLAIVFVFLAADEFTSIHEVLIKPVKSVVDNLSIESNYLYFGWFLPYVLFAAMVASIFLKVLLRLPAKTRQRFLFGGSVFMLGAVVMEMVGGKYWADAGWNVEGTDAVDINYALIVTVEEFLEMAGIVIFNYALAAYYFQIEKLRPIVLNFSDDPKVKDQSR